MKFFIVLCFLFYLANGANILVLENTASPSHHIWIKTLLTALAERGHNITSLSPDREENKIPNLHYIHLEKVYEVLYDANNAEHTEDMDFFSMTDMPPTAMYFMWIEYCTQIISGAASSKGYQELLNYPDDFKFDLIIYDYIIGPMFLNFAEKFGNPPIIAATAFYSASMTTNMVGGAISPSYIPLPFLTFDLNTFWGRVQNYFICTLDHLIKTYYIAPKLNAIARKDFPNGADLRDLEKRTKLVLVNKNPASDVIEPLLPNVIPVGGLQIQRNKGLPEDLQKVMDSAKEGAILFSLGTNVQSAMLGKARQTEILEAFRALPQYTFLWKFEADELPVKVPDNVIVRKWLPQSDLLAHPNLKLFISHSGLLSTQEAAWFGVPILGLPVFADQFDNLRMSMQAGVAEQGSIGKIERFDFQKLIEKMMKDPKYREKANIQSKIFRDQKETPLERAVWWTEYVLRHPDMTFMRSESLDFSLPVRHSWDVLAFFFSVILGVLLILLKISCCIFRCLCSNKNSVKHKRE
uniref:UDP-glucuronosyltransferase n=1 Tax=Lutzomyia longipalpis TaxID=7200 RepID=A0A7G3B2A5_LUTLO